MCPKQEALPRCPFFCADSLADEMDSLSDPTIRLALALGLDPLQLPVCGGPGIRSSSPAAGKLAVAAVCLGAGHMPRWHRHLQAQQRVCNAG